MLKGMQGKGGVINFYINFEVVYQVVGLQEVGYGCCIKIILMFGGFYRFRFNEEVVFEVLFVGVVFGCMQEGCQVVKFVFYICIEQREIVFLAVLEDVVFIVQFDCGIEGEFYLCVGVGYYSKVRVCCCVVYIVGVGKQVGGVLQQAYF